MSGIDLSGAHDDAHGQAAPASAASALLSATDIWSAGPLPPAQALLETKTQPPEKAADKTGEKLVEKNDSPAERPATARGLAPSAVMAALKSAASSAQRIAEPLPAPASHRGDIAERNNWPPRKLSLALQGGGTFAAFTWGVLERLLEEEACEIDAISGASAGAVNATLLACGLAEGGRERARKLLDKFWNRTVQEASFRSLMLLGGFSPAGSSVAFSPALRSGHFDPLDLDPLRRQLAKYISFEALRGRASPKLVISATRIRDGSLKLFRNQDITADVVLASTCPPLVHCAVDINGEAYWDGGYAANPPLVGLVQDSAAADLLLVQVTPARDSYVPINSAAIDRRLDQIAANSALNAELAALDWARQAGVACPRIFRIAAEDEIEGLVQRSAVDLGRGFISLLHRKGRAAADRWLRQDSLGAPLLPMPVQKAAVQTTAAEPALI